jgi:hypothetical protein
MKTRMMNGNDGRGGGRVVILELLKNSQESTEGGAAYRYRAVGPDYIADLGGRLEILPSYCDSS